MKTTRVGNASWPNGRLPGLCAGSSQLGTNLCTPMGTARAFQMQLRRTCRPYMQLALHSSDEEPREGSAMEPARAATKRRGWAAAHSPRQRGQRGAARAESQAVGCASTSRSGTHARDPYVLHAWWCAVGAASRWAPRPGRHAAVIRRGPSGRASSAVPRKSGG